MQTLSRDFQKRTTKFLKQPIEAKAYWTRNQNRIFVGDLDQGQ